MCRGCQRFSHEVIQWNTYSPDQKTIVLSRIEKIITQVMTLKIVINTPHQLETRLQQANIPYRKDLNCFSWAYSLLRALKSQTIEFNEFGIEVLARYKKLSTKELFTQINQECFALSEAYYDTHITRAFRHAETTSIGSNTE